MRFTTSWRIPGTDTFRLASGKLFGTYGGNAQNPSEFLMRAMEADPGYLFLQPDQSGAEALVVAHEAPPGRMLRLFECGIKPHTDTAIQLFSKFRVGDPKGLLHIKPDDLKVHPLWPSLKELVESKSPKEYGTSKMIRHATNYDMKGPTFATNALHRSEGEIILTVGEATKLLDEDRVIFPEIPAWHAEVRAKGMQERALKNLFGHPRYFGEYEDENLYRRMYAFVPQSTVGMITNYAFVEMQDYIEETGRDWHLLNNKHDSLLLMVPEKDKEEGIAKVRTHIERRLVSSRGVEYQMKSGISVGRNWAKWHPVKNPDGMKELK